MRAGAIDGLSIGFRTVRGRTDAKSGRAAAARSGPLGGVGGDVPDAAGGAGVGGEGDARLALASDDAAGGAERCGRSPSPLVGEGWARGLGRGLRGCTPPLTPPRKGEGSRVATLAARLNAFCETMEKTNGSSIERPR